MLQSATGEAAGAVGDTFVIHMDRESLGDRPMGNSKFLVGKTPDELALFGIPRPGHPYWNAATVDAMARRHRGLDMSPWREALPGC